MSLPKVCRSSPASSKIFAQPCLELQAGGTLLVFTASRYVARTLVHTGDHGQLQIPRGQDKVFYYVSDGNISIKRKRGCQNVAKIEEFLICLAVSQQRAYVHICTSNTHRSHVFLNAKHGSLYFEGWGKEFRASRGSADGWMYTCRARVPAAVFVGVGVVGAVPT